MSVRPPSSSSSSSFPQAEFVFEGLARSTLTPQNMPQAPTQNILVNGLITTCKFPNVIATLIDQYVFAKKTILFFHTHDSICYRIPTGKPHPQQLCNRATEREENRSFVYQKGAQCSDEGIYHAFNLIRFRIGKNYAFELFAERQTEIACSQYRKAYRTWKTVERPIALDIEFIKKQHTVQSAFALNGDKPPCTDWQEFEKLALQECFFENPGLRKISLAVSLQRINRAVMALLYQLTPAKWQAENSSNSMPVDMLIADLWQKGPLVMQGLFGSDFYSEKPVLLPESTAEQEVFGWEMQQLRHLDLKLLVLRPLAAITVVGARKEKDEEYVYYVDPSDASVPYSDKGRKLHKISYRGLQSRALPFCPGVFAYAASLSPNKDAVTLIGPREQESSIEIPEKSAEQPMAAPKLGRPMLTAKRTQKPAQK